MHGGHSCLYSDALIVYLHLSSLDARWYLPSLSTTARLAEAVVIRQPRHTHSAAAAAAACRMVVVKNVANQSTSARPFVMRRRCMTTAAVCLRNQVLAWRRDDDGMGRLHLTKSETRFNTDKNITYFFVVRPVETIVII
jgi:hypothetical protein